MKDFGMNIDTRILKIVPVRMDEPFIRADA